MKSARLKLKLAMFMVFFCIGMNSIAFLFSLVFCQFNYPSKMLRDKLSILHKQVIKMSFIFLIFFFDSAKIN